MSSSVERFGNTRDALKKLKDMFKCQKCLEFTSSPVTLGGCEHIYCSTCCEEYLGSSCPECSIPAHVKDADVDRQLFNLASLCAKLDRVLAPDKKLDDNNKENEDPQLQCTPNQPIPGYRSHDSHVTQVESEVSASRNRRSVEQSVETSSEKTNILQHERNKSKTRRKSLGTSPSSSHKLSPSVKRLSGSPGNPSSKRRRKSLPMDQKTMTQYYDYDDDDDDYLSLINEGDNDSDVNSSKKVDQINVQQALNRKPKVVQKTSSSKKTRQRRSLDSARSEYTSNITSKCGNDSKHSEASEVKVNTTKKGKDKKKSVGNDEMLPGNSKGQSTPVSAKSRSNMTKITPRTNRQPEVHTPGSKSEVPASVTPKGRQPRNLKCTQSPALNKRNAKGETPLQVAAIKNDIRRVKELLGDGANPNVRDNAGWTPLHEACNHGYVEIAELLLNHGAMINIPGLENDTPLHDAINNSQVECVCLLVSRGASLTLRNMHGQTATDIAQTDVMKKALKTPVVSAGTTEEVVDLLEYQAPCLLGTGLSREDKVLLHKSATKLKIKLLDEVTPEVTHIVTKFNADGMCPRTVKIVQGILMGKWILNMEWLEMCMEVGKLVCEEAFEAHGTSLFPHSQSPNKGRTNRKQQLPGLFDGCHFYFHGSFEYAVPSKEDLTSIISAGGGKFLSREPKPGHLDMQKTVPFHAVPGTHLESCCVYVVYDKTVGMKQIRTKYMCSVPSTWVMDCASNFQLMLVPDNEN